jgi:hypothetical protein
VPTPKTAPLSHPRPLSQSPHVNRRRGLLLSLPTLLALLVALAAGPAQAASAPASLTLESAVGRSAPLTSVLVGSQPLRTGITPRVAAHLYDRIAVATGVAAKSLPAPRQIEAAWGAGVYRHGGLMSSIEHVNYRHAFGSGFEDVSRFSRGTSVRQIKQYVEDALRHGVVNGGTINYNVGRVIGTDAAGNPVTGIRVHVRNDIIRTAFPVAP